MGGMGDDTAMMIAEMYERGYEPDEIVFCNTRSEFPHTYKFIEFLTKWCSDRNWSKVVVLEKLDKHGKPLGIMQSAIDANSLPPVSFGFKTCSQRFKTETADKYFNNNPAALRAWGVSKKGGSLDDHTGVILRCVGINADEPNRVASWRPTHKWIQVFPLYDWGIGERESDAVERVGLYYPGKSSCVCCANLSGAELATLRDDYPTLFLEVKTMESNYRNHNMREDSTVIGMFRSKTIDDKLLEYENNPKYRCSLDDQQCNECK